MENQNYARRYILDGNMNKGHSICYIWFEVYNIFLWNKPFTLDTHKSGKFIPKFSCETSDIAPIYDYQGYFGNHVDDGAWFAIESTSTHKVF